MEANTTPLWAREFGNDYAVPDEITNDPELVDCSWHNDTHPSFMLKAHEARNGEGPDIRLWVDHPDQKMRELELPRRFSVIDFSLDCNSGLLYEGDDMHEAIRVLKGVK
jgi:hypothetical protein